MNYAEIIKESESELLKLEKQYKDRFRRDRIRFLRYLKTGEAKSQQQAGKLLGVALRQSQRIWRRYRQGGIEAMGEVAYKGKACKLSEAEQVELLELLKSDEVSTLKEAADLIATHFGERYTPEGVSLLFRRLGVILKTGRPVHIEKDPEAETRFKKCSPG